MAPDAVADQLRVRLVSPADVRAGETVPLMVQLENTGKRPLDLYLRGRPIAFDVVVSDRRGALVWQRLRGAIVPAIVQLRTIEPGTTLELEGTWDQRDDAGKPVAPGEYLLRASVLTDQPLPIESASTMLRIASRG